MNFSLNRQDIINEMANFSQEIKPVAMYLKETGVQARAIRFSGLFVHEVPCDVNDVAYRIGYWTKINHNNGAVDVIIQDAPNWGEFDTIDMAEAAFAAHMLVEVKD